MRVARFAGTRRRSAATVGTGILCGAMAAAVLPGMSASASSSKKPPLYIEAVMALSGTFGLYGHVDLQGLQAQVNVINRSGGVDGRKLKIEVRDDASTAAKAVIAAKTLLSSVPRSDVIYCDPGSVGIDTVATLAVFTAAKCLTISPAATTGPGGDETFTKFPYTFYDYTDESTAGTPQTIAVKAVAGPRKKVAIVVGTTVGSQHNIAPAATKIKKLGLDLVDTVTVSETGTTFTSQLAKVQQDGATAMYVHVDSPTVAVTIMKNITALGWHTVHCVFGNTSDSSNVLENIPAGVQSQFFAQSVNRADIEGFGKGTASFKKLVDAITALGTVKTLAISADNADGVNIGVWAYEKAKSTTAGKERAALDSLGKKHDLPKGVLRVVPQPHYTKQAQDLDHATFHNYWGLLKPAAAPVTTQWPGLFVRLPTGTLTTPKTGKRTTIG